MKTENSSAVISGRLTDGLEFSHEFRDEKFYRTQITVKRKSGQADIIEVVLPDVLADGLEIGCYVLLTGQFRSRNDRKDGQHTRCLLFFFALECEIIEEEQIPDLCRNEIMLEGYLCKKPEYRKTPLGREITDLIIAVNRSYGKSDYLPVLAWGRNARRAEQFKVGDRLLVYGRIQSRIYNKTLPDGNIEERTAYEVSSNMIRQCRKEDADGETDKENS